MAGSLAMSPPPPHMHINVPATQPLPGFETPSAFEEPSSPSMPSSLYPATSSYAEYSRAELVPVSHIYDPRYHDQPQPLPPRQYASTSTLPGTQPSLEHAIESVQGHLAALTERLELLETNARQFQRSSVSLATGGTSPKWPGAGRGSPAGNQPQWDSDDLGMWSLVLNPLSRGLASLRALFVFFVRSENRSPTFIVVRRLCLDVSFLLCVLAVVRAIWKKSGVRRREVRMALIVLWRALVGSKKERVMVDRGV
jgi:hypothetical protein